MLRTLRNLLRNKNGQGLAEYGLLVAAIIVMSLAAVSLYGHKTADMWALGAALLPGAHADDLGAIRSGKLIATTGGGTGNPIELHTADIVAGTGNDIGVGLGFGAGGAGTISVEP